MAPAAAPCPNHPEREAIGICVRCRTRVCSECSTKIDGINHCVRCLAAAAAAAEGPDAGRDLPFTGRVRVRSLLAASGLLALTALLVWSMLEVLLPGSQ